MKNIPEEIKEKESTSNMSDDLFSRESALMSGKLEAENFLKPLKMLGTH